MEFYQDTAEEAYKELNSSEKGLTNEQAKQRLKEHGLNEVKKSKGVSKLGLLLNQVKNFIIYVLIAAALVSFLMGETTDSIVIAVIIILNIILGFVQEYKAEKAIEALRKLSSPKSLVMRNGKLEEIDSKFIVPGDILIIEEGHHIPADARIIESNSLRIDESTFTGESVPVSKISKEIKKDSIISDRTNILFAGTIAVRGRGKAIVYATGSNTQLGKIAKGIQETEDNLTPLQKQLNHLGVYITIAILFICAVIVLLEYLQTGELFESLLIAVALAVAAIPEGLPAVITITLALGTQRMSKKNVLIRRLPAVETLGSTTVICVPANTPIICNPEIKNIDSVELEDEVLGLDGSFHKVLKTYKRNYTGKMVCIKPMGLPELKITPEHPVLIARESRSRPVEHINNKKCRPRRVSISSPIWVPASEVRTGDLVLIPRIKEQQEYKFKFKKGRCQDEIVVNLDEELAELFGWFLAEGCTSIRKGSYHIKFYLGKNERQNVARVKYLLEKKLGLRAYVYETPTSTSIVVINKDLVYFLRENFGTKAKNKKIPEFIFRAPNNIVTKFLLGYLNGDGNVDDYTIRFTTVSRGLAHQLIILFAKLGIRARLYEGKERKDVKIKDRDIKTGICYQIIISGSQASVIHPVKYKLNQKKKNLFLKDGDFVYVPVRSVKTENSSLEVFNIETSSQTYTLPFIVHNCTDKTGTLTKNEMTVTELYSNNSLIKITGKGYNLKGEFFKNDKKIANLLEHKKIFECAFLCNNAVIDGPSDPTEKAILIASKKSNFSFDYKRVMEVPFSSETKYMITIHTDGKNDLSYIKGAPEIILEKCTKILLNGKMISLTQERKKQIIENYNSMASRALRVLAFGFNPEGKRKDFVFLGLMGMIDPPRDGVKESIQKCREAGIKVIMITGDHAVTANAIAKEIGIRGASLTGADLEKMSLKELENIVENIGVFARVSPEHKVLILKALKNKGHVVAMTGDGVNDAPALKLADIGTAVGSGTDVAKESSDMILVDDNFVSIVSAVMEGRGIYNNIKKFVNFLFSCNLGEVLVVFLSILLGFPLPLIAIQILWINLLTDGFPALALGMDPIDPKVMEKPPRKKDERIITSSDSVNLLVQGVIITFGVLFLFNLYLPQGLEYARTIAFFSLVLFQMFNVLNYRAGDNSIFSRKLIENKWLLGAIVFSLALQLIVIYGFNDLFGTVPLTLEDALLCVLVSSLVLLFYEGVKVIAWFKERNNTKVLNR